MLLPLNVHEKIKNEKNRYYWNYFKDYYSSAFPHAKRQNSSSTGTTPAYRCRAPSCGTTRTHQTGGQRCRTEETAAAA